MSLLTAIILAAGKGTRMRSQLPKVLHKVNGKAMAAYAIEAARGSGAGQIVLVVGHEADEVKKALGGGLEYAVQSPQLGTGHALQLAIPSLKKGCRDIMVLCGDTPLLRGETLKELYNFFLKTKASCTVLSAFLPEPSGYGRLIRGEDGNLKAIVEQKDANPQELGIKEINTGTYCFCLEDILPLINNLENRNAQGEYYITDLIGALVKEGKTVNALPMGDITQVLGINDRIQLAQASAIMRQIKNRQLMEAGVTIIDPETTYIESDCKVGIDTIIEPNCFLRGDTVIGENCIIGPNSDIRDSQIGDGGKVVNALVIQCRAGNNCDIGPFSYIRPGTVLADFVKVGGFVEMKKAHIDTGSKVPHLSYVGDALIGKKVNIGCGTITCNYDGYNKYQTIIEDEAFIGSNSNFIAPVRVGKNAHVAAGSTITQNVPENALGIARGKQRNIEGWVEEWHKRRDCPKKETKD